MRKKAVETKKKRNIRFAKESRKVYAAAVLGVAALLACAFHLPRFLFQVRDNVLCRDTVLGERESVDVLIGNSYDLSLYNRMFNFAEGLSKGSSYYVSEQDMEVDEELYDWFNGIYSNDNPIWILMDSRLITPSIMEFYTIERRKQYVIYSDDYAKGVNFIIWYLEMAGHDGERIEILVDAETATVYGLKAEKNGLLAENERDNKYYFWAGSLVQHLQNSGLTAIWQLWLYLAIEFEAISPSEVEAVYSIADNKNIVAQNGMADSDDDAQAKYQQLAALSSGVWYDDNTLVFSLPYEEYLLDIRLELMPEDEYPAYRYHDIFYGVDAICRMIPEFMEES